MNRRVHFLSMTTTFPLALPPFLTVAREAVGGEPVWAVSCPGDLPTLYLTDETFAGGEDFARRFVTDRLREFCGRIDKATKFAAWEAAQ